ncbi:MAG TPA: trehalose-phosphatase [Acidimicrobiales bacterium]|nr:trehalose-phosphatase [Acidimicrobiales bacterium]
MAGDARPRIGQLRECAAEAAVLLDFDGTLAAIGADPEQARPVPGSVEVLRRLVRRFRLVAVISGRPAGFLAAHLDVPGLALLGAYGLERVTPAGVAVAPEVAPWLPVVAEAAAAARRAAPPRAVVEDKGVSITLHYRAAPETEAWARSFAAAESARRGLAVFDARRSVELRPPLAVDKGTAAAALLDEAGATAACATGDDEGDLRAFEAVAQLPLSLRVAVRSDEVPAELLAAADLVVDGPDGVVRLLGELAG